MLNEHDARRVAAEQMSDTLTHTYVWLAYTLDHLGGEAQRILQEYDGPERLEKLRWCVETAQQTLSVLATARAEVERLGGSVDAVVRYTGPRPGVRGVPARDASRPDGR
jgi:hypothetical protein